MADLDTNTAILIAIITFLSVVVGGLITSGVNFLIEQERGKREAVKLQQEKEARDLELRNQAYIKFLTIPAEKAYEPGKADGKLINPELVDESVALVLAYGSKDMCGLVLCCHPFSSLDMLLTAQVYVMAELVELKGGAEAYRKYRSKLKGIDSQT